MARSIRMTRTYPRYRLPYPVVFGGVSGIGEGVLTTLSMQGCSVRSDREVESGSVVRVRVLLPDHPTALPVDVGVVKWVRDDQFGVEFVSLPLTARQRLNRALRAELIQFFKNRRAERSESGAVREE